MSNLITPSQARQITEAQAFFAQQSRKNWLPWLIGAVVVIDTASLLATLIAQ